ncbi:hypothetical protein D9M72_484920 [compost metagenome]
MKLAPGDFIQLPELLHEHRIRKEFVDIPGSLDCLDIDDRLSVRALRQGAPQKAFLPFGDVVHDVLDDREGFLLLAGVSVDDVDDKGRRSGGS